LLLGARGARLNGGGEVRRGLQGAELQNACRALSRSTPSNSPPLSLSRPHLRSLKIGPREQRRKRVAEEEVHECSLLAPNSNALRMCFWRPCEAVRIRFGL